MRLSKKIITIGLALFSVLSFSANAQEGVEPIRYNIELMKEPFGMQKSQTATTFDSTVIYYLDTLQLPFFDEFSKNRIQTYDNDVTVPGVWSEEYFKILDDLNDPYPAGTTFTQSVTFRRVYDANLGTTTVQNFQPITVQYSDLSVYPVQYTNIQVYPAYYIYDTIGIVNDPDTVFIQNPEIQQGSARQFFLEINNPQSLWIDDHVYHNYRFADRPWSLGVMTFDGTDRKGYPYAIGTTTVGYADYLTSKPIDLSGNSAADSIYLSFLYQFEGFGDTPEEVDSLIVQFYDGAASQWRRVWAKGGTEGPTDFRLAHIPVVNAAFFRPDFQFRFVNRGGLSGALDHIHIDYVHMRTFSGIQDTLIEDFALVYPTKSLLERYSSVPWDHYKNNPTGKMNSEMEIVVRNSYLNGGTNVTSANGASVSVYHNNALEGTFNINGQAMVNYNPPTQSIPDYAPRTTYTSYHPVNGYQFDPSKLGNYQDFKVVTVANVPVGSNNTVNDTSIVYQTFRNYYAYDDGSAELAYGPTGAQSRLAIQYEPYEADTIIGVTMCFVPTVANVLNSLFQVTIWADNNGQPGAVIYEDGGFNLRQPSYGYGRNGLTTYWTEYPVPVSGKFYVGFKQIDPVRLGVGLDRNTDRSEYTFYSVDQGATWSQSEISGAVMIRPIFSTLMNDEMSIPHFEKISLDVYPNPTESHFTVRGNLTGNETFVVRDLTGRELIRTQQPTIDISQEPAGMYLIEVQGAYANTIKVIKR